MRDLMLPVRFYSSDHATLTLDPRTTAVMVVDANGPQSATLLTDSIAPVVHAARAVGVRIFYFHEDGYGTGGPADHPRIARRTSRPWAGRPLLRAAAMDRCAPHLSSRNCAGSR